MNSISNRVLRLREEKKFSRKDLAELAEISQPTIYNIENGKTDNITLSVGKKIAKALGISFGELFEIESPANEKNQETLIAEIEQLKKENVKLKEENSNLKNQLLQDNKMLIDSLKSKNILYDFALSLYVSSGEYDKARTIAYQKFDDIIERGEYFSKLMPFDRENQERIIKYISENFIWKAKE